MVISIRDSWARIKAWMRVNAPSDYDLLQPAVSESQLQAAQEHFRGILPDEFIQFYREMNATDPNGESAGIFPSTDEWDIMAFCPLALAEVIREWDAQKELLEMGDFPATNSKSADGIQEVWWNIGWIPFASNGGGDYYCIDTAPAAAGIQGQIISHSHETGEHKILAASLAEYLAQLADDLEAGRFEYSEYGMQKV